MALRKGPLSHLTVLDLCRVRSGPTAVRQLADWGANVIKIEAPEAADSARGMGGSRSGPDFQNLHRNKRAITLNLKLPAGIEVLKRLVVDADVLVENYRPDVKHRLGIDYETLQAINPRLVYASISGFGQDGPYAQRPGFDQIAQGLGGLMSITGLPGQGPVRVGVPIADLAAGLYGAIGIFIALIERHETGRGQWLRTSLLQAQIAMLDFQAARWTVAGEVPAQAGNNHPTSIPTGVFKTTDGYLNIAVTGERMFKRLCETLGAGDIAADDRFTNGESRLKYRDELNALLQEYLSQRSTPEWVEVMNTAGVPCGPINSIDQVFADPQVQHLKMTRTVHHPQLGDLELINNALELSNAPDSAYTPTPNRGQHTDQVLAEFGYSEAEVETLRQSGVI